MPTAPMNGINQSASGQSPMVEQPSQANLLMAAAELHKGGAFNAPSEGPGSKARSPKRKLRVIK